MMSDIEATVEEVAAAGDWNVRVSLIRRVPEAFGTNLHRDVYARIADRVYVPNLVPDFAYVHWRVDYELPYIQAAYQWAYDLTGGFTRIDIEVLTQAVAIQSRTLLIFRLLLGLTAQEFAAATRIVAERHDVSTLGAGRIKSLEAGTPCSPETARCCALVIDEGMRGELFGAPPQGTVQPKIRKPDTIEGWVTVQRYATEGVPLDVFLHQRHYGGAFRQLLDATSTDRGSRARLAADHGCSWTRGPGYRRPGLHTAHAG